ncbi:MAG TPA: lipocalin family protein [Flavobacteriales bacterium]|nr:lipocalin family protein [Flavobacteriales bacterium]
MRIIPFILSLFISSIHAQPLQTVKSVDLTRYAGKWYEIASYPHSFQRGCTCTTAEYIITDKSYLRVINTCRRDSVTGKVSTIQGRVYGNKKSGNSKLKVQFFWPFRAKYWIIELAPDYSYAVVGHPNRKSLWILSRTPKMNEEVYKRIVAGLKDKGYDYGGLVVTQQDCH